MCSKMIDFVAKMIMIVINIITLVISLGLICGMIYAMVGLNINEIVEVFGETDITTMMYAMYGFLGALLIVSLVGLLGVFYKSKLLLGIYSVFLMACLLGVAIVATLWFLEGDSIMENARVQMKDSITYEYRGDFKTDVFSIAWNLIQYQLKTCGVDNYTDYVASEWYNGTYNSNSFNGYDLPFPISCCEGGDNYISLSKVIDGELSADMFNETWVLNCMGITDYGNGTITTDGPTHPNNKGSLDEVKTLLKSSIYVVAAFAAAVVVLQLVLIWASCHLIDSKQFTGEDEDD